jgi:type I restriction enzyme S subunit
VDESKKVVFASLIETNVLQIGDGYRAKNEELGGDGIIFLRAGHIHDNGIDFDGVERFHAHLSNKVAGKMARAGDAVITTKGNSTGRVFYVREGLPPFVYSPHLSYWRSIDRDALDPRFLYYWSRTAEFQTQLRGMSASTDMAPYLSLGDQRRLRITLPSIAHQRRVGEILGALDDKIDLNRRMNATLEAMARALFQAWFVDFDSAKAKEIGWTTKKLGEVSSINERKVAKDTAPSEIQYIDISSVTVGRLEGTVTYALNEAPSRAQRLVAHGDTIWSCVRPNRRSYLFIHSPPSDLVVSTGFAVLTPKGVMPSYLYAWVTTDEFVDYLTNHADGSAYPAVRPDDFARAEILVPDAQSMQRFEDVVGPMRSLIAQNEQECRTLADLRDTLLPKLMSGEVRVQP